MASLPTKILDFRGFDSSIILILRGGILMSIGISSESLSQQILVGIILVGRLRVASRNREKRRKPAEHEKARSSRRLAAEAARRVSSSHPGILVLLALAAGAALGLCARQTSRGAALWRGWRMRIKTHVSVGSKDGIHVSY